MKHQVLFSLKKIMKNIQDCCLLQTWLVPSRIIMFGKQTGKGSSKRKEKLTGETD